MGGGTDKKGNTFIDGGGCQGLGDGHMRKVTHRHAAFQGGGHMRKW